MTDHTALWAIFILLCVLFVLVVITARRGPWQRSEPHPFAPIVMRVPIELLGQIKRVTPLSDGSKIVEQWERRDDGSYKHMITRDDEP